MSSDVSWHIRDKPETNAEAWFSIALRPRKPEGSLGRTAQDGHLDSHTAPEWLSVQQKRGWWLFSAASEITMLHSPWRECQVGQPNNWLMIAYYSAILRSLEQTHSARMWFYVSD